jgi:hypothetical protein
MLWYAGCHTRFDTEVFGYALDNNAQMAGGGITPMTEHPVERLFAQAGLPSKFLEGDFRVPAHFLLGLLPSAFLAQRRFCG